MGSLWKNMPKPEPALADTGLYEIRQPCGCARFLKEIGAVVCEEHGWRLEDPLLQKTQLDAGEPEQDAK